MSIELIIYVGASTIAMFGWPAYLGLMNSPSYGEHPKRFSKRRHIIILSVLIPCLLIFARMIYLKETGNWIN